MPPRRYWALGSPCSASLRSPDNGAGPLCGLGCARAIAARRLTTRAIRKEIGIVASVNPHNTTSSSSAKAQCACAQPVHRSPGAFGSVCPLRYFGKIGAGFRADLVATRSTNFFEGTGAAKDGSIGAWFAVPGQLNRSKADHRGSPPDARQICPIVCLPRVQIRCPPLLVRGIGPLQIPANHEDRQLRIVLLCWSQPIDSPCVHDS